MHGAMFELQKRTSSIARTKLITDSCSHINLKLINFSTIKHSEERTASGSPSPPHQNQKQNFSPPELKCPRTIIHPSQLSSPPCASSPDSLPRRQLLHSSRLRSKKHHDCPDSCTLPPPRSSRSEPWTETSSGRRIAAWPRQICGDGHSAWRSYILPILWS